MNDLFKRVTVSKFDGDGIEGYSSKLISFYPNIPDGYKIHSFVEFNNDAGTFIASVSSIANDAITLRICNFSANIQHPSTMTVTVNCIKSF